VDQSTATLEPHAAQKNILCHENFFYIDIVNHVKALCQELIKIVFTILMASQIKNKIDLSSETPVPRLKMLNQLVITQKVSFFFI
jgi:hypothetical protein